MASRLSRNLTVPNLLTVYRLAAAPVVAVLALLGLRWGFVVLILISLFTDLIDGPLARWLKQETRFGARSDALADSMTLIAGLIGVYMFEWQALSAYQGWLWLFLGSLGLACLVSLVKFGKLPAFHLYSFKMNDIVLTGFFATLFLYAFIPGFFIFAMLFATLASLEILMVALVLKAFDTDQKGLWWVLRRRARGP